MPLRRADVIKGSAAAVVLVGAVVIGAMQMSRSGDGEEHLKIWFYDVSESKLYAAPKDTLAPHAGVGGATDDGVKAIVVACRGECGDASKREIAYLEKCSPELKGMLEGIRAARARGEKYTGKMPAREDDFVNKNTFVRRAGEETWHAMSSKVGREIVVEWQRKTCADGQSRVVCTP